MACCALAAFLISQIIFGLDWARARLGLVEPERLTANAVVAWSLQDAPAAAPARAITGARLRLAAMGGGLAFVLLAALTVRVEAGPHGWDAISLICTGHGLTSLAVLRGG